MSRLRPVILLGGALALTVLLGSSRPSAPSQEASEGIEVRLCDNETTTMMPRETARTKENGMKIAQALMSQWKHKHPERDWVEKEHEKHEIVPPVDNRDLVGKSQGHTYARITERDVAMWNRELVKFVAEGSRVFHSADELGSQIAVSCDMCHPDASNTHAETYPKMRALEAYIVAQRKGTELQYGKR
jgi:thiosulfate dehydrogenase